MIKYATKIFRCIKCGWQTTISEDELEKTAAIECPKGATHFLEEVIETDAIQEVQEVQPR